MADQRGGQHGEGMKQMVADKLPEPSQVVAIVTLFPLGGTLLALSGIVLTGSVVALAIATPLFILFSPILVPAVLVIGLAVTGFLASGAFGLTAVTSLSWIVNSLRVKGPPGRGNTLEYARPRMAETAGYAGQRTKEMGKKLESKAHETAGT